MHYQVLIQVSLGYPCVRGRLPTRYSPVRRYPAARSTEASLTTFPLDLHVLGTPPAFILSQDQTLNKIVSNTLSGNKSKVWAFRSLMNDLRSFF